jgi:pilus assembly protein CpaB
VENRRAIIISIICLLVSIALISAYVQVKRRELTSEFGDEVTVVVAAEAIPEYAIIKPNMLKVETVFKNFRQPQTVTDISEIVGKAAYVPVYKGEQITLTKLVQSDGRPVLDRQVEKKMRAITLQITPYSGVGKLIRPGNRVDLILSAHYEKEGVTYFEVKTLVQNVLVLATGKNIQNAVPTRVNKDLLPNLEAQFEERHRKDLSTANAESLHTQRPDDNYSTLTLELSPEDTEKVIYISTTFGENSIYFTLRNGSDIEVAKLETTLLDDVLAQNSDYGLSKKKPPPPPPAKAPKYYDSVGGRAVPIY